MKYARLSTIDSPSQGSLYSARRGKKIAWKVLTNIRREIRENPFRVSMRLRMDKLHAESSHYEWQRMERMSLEAIEERANELGLTTHKALAS